VIGLERLEKTRVNEDMREKDGSMGSLDARLKRDKRAFEIGEIRKRDT